MIDDLFAFMRYERKQVAIQFLNVRKLVAYTVISKLQRQTSFIKI